MSDVTTKWKLNSSDTILEQLGSILKICLTNYNSKGHIARKKVSGAVFTTLNLLNVVLLLLLLSLKGGDPLHQGHESFFLIC